MTAETFLIIRIVAAAIGLVLCWGTWLDAVADYRVLRKLKLNSAREILTTGQVLEESGRLVLHAGFLVITVRAWFIGQTTPSAIVSSIFIVMTFVLVAMSINSMVTRRKILNVLSRED